MGRGSVFVSLLLGFLFLVACRGGDVARSSSEKSLGFSAAIVVDGPIDDGSFNKSSWDGMLKVQKDLGYRVAYKQTTQPSDMLAAFNSFFEEGYDVMVGIGFKMSDTVFDQASFNPDRKYVVVDFTGFRLLPDNMLAIGFRPEQSSFLAGYIAGKVTKTGRVGFVGGVSGIIIDAFDYGFDAGVYVADPAVVVVKQYADSFADVTKGKNIAEIMHTNGVDIIYQAAGATGFGVIEATKESRSRGNDVWVIGVDTDQSPLAPDAVLLSTIKDIGFSLYSVLKDYKEGMWQGGAILEYGLSQGAVDIIVNKRYVSEDIMVQVESFREKIINSDIVVPFNTDTFLDFKNTFVR